MKLKLLAIAFIIVTIGVSAQTLVSITPNSGAKGQTLNVTITGNNTHFASGSGTFVGLFDSGSPTTGIFGSNISATSATSMSVTFFIQASATGGLYSLYVWNDLDSMLVLSNSFTALSSGVAETVSQQGSMSIYPNPAKEIITMELNEQDAEVKQIEVSDILGKTRREIEIPEINSDGKLELDIRNLGIPSGTYFIRVTTLKQVYINKVLIE